MSCVLKALSSIFSMHDYFRLFLRCGPETNCKREMYDTFYSYFSFSFLLSLIYGHQISCQESQKTCRSFSTNQVMFQLRPLDVTPLGPCFAQSYLGIICWYVGTMWYQYWTRVSHIQSKCLKSWTISLALRLISKWQNKFLINQFLFIYKIFFFSHHDITAIHHCISDIQYFNTNQFTSVHIPPAVAPNFVFYLIVCLYKRNFVLI